MTDSEVKVGLNGNGFKMPPFGFPGIALFGELAEQTAARAKEGCEKIKAASEEMTEALRESYSSNARTATNYGFKVIEISSANTASAIDFFVHLLDSKSATDAVTLSVEQGRKAFDAATRPEQGIVGGLPRSLRRKRASRSRSTPPRFSSKPTKGGPQFASALVEEGSSRLD